MSEQNIAEIERALERDRAALAQSLASLRDRMRPASILTHSAASLKSGAASLMARAAGGLSRGSHGTDRQDGRSGAAGDEAPALAGTRFEALSRWEDEGGPPAPVPEDPEADWLVEARGLRSRALALLARIDDAARRGLVPAAELARHRAEIVAAFAADTAAALGKGLETLDESARIQAVAARERIYLARVTVAERARAEVEARPLMAGAMAAAAGVALACLLPRSEAEDRLMGPPRDRLAGDLKRLARHEFMLASHLAQGLSAAFRRDLDRVASVFAPGGAGPDGPSSPQ